MTTYTKLRDGSWGLRGHRLVAGQVVEVVKRDGTTKREVVGYVLWTGPDGTSIARIGGQQAKTKSRTGGKVCAFCHRRVSRLYEDLEDGGVKCHDCCDMPRE